MTISNIANALDPKDSPAQELDFMSALPCDIVSVILSSLTQQECLTCMTVCRDWYFTIPQYTQAVWKELQLGVQDASTNHQRRQLCLGSHVKRVVLQSVEDKEEERPLVTLMQRLLDWGCTEVESLEFVCCSSTDQDAFVDLLGRLASRLKHLKFERHNTSILILPVLNACRQLTHLSYQHIATPLEVDSQLATLSSTVPIDYRSKLTHLQVDAVLDKDGLERILKRCPELQCYVGITWSTSQLRSVSLQPTYEYLDTSSLLSLCPKINALVGDFSCHDFYDLSIFNLYTSRLPGLRYFIPSELDKENEIASYLVKNQDTLEYLNIHRCVWADDWSPVTESLRMPNLRTLTFKNISINSASSLATMLSYSSDLQELDLGCPLLDFDSAFVRSLRIMQSVRYLRLKEVRITDGPTMAALFERFPALEILDMDSAFLPLELPKYFQCPKQLKSLAITSTEWNRNDNIQEPDMYEAVARFLERLTSDTKLETIELLDIPKLRTNGLLAITKVPTLKSLTVHLQYILTPPGVGNSRGRGRLSPTLWSRYSRQQDAEFLQFVKMLCETKIEDLTFFDCYDLPSAVLQTLAELPLLRKFRASGYFDHEIWTCMRGEDLASMLHKSQSLVRLYFADATIEGDGETLDCEQLNAMIQHQSSGHNTTRTNTGRWVARGHYNGVIIEGLTINWLSD